MLNRAVPTTFDMLCKTKVDAEHGVLHGWSIVSKVKGEPYVDFHGDWIPESAMYKAALKFANGPRAMKIQHTGEVVGTVPFIMPLDAATKAAYGLEGDYEGLAVGLKPDDKSVIDDYKSGKRSELSIGGRRVMDEVVDRETGKSLGWIDVSKMRVELGKDATVAALDAAYEGALDAIAKASDLVRNRLKRIMHEFEIYEISPVDRAAQQPARIGVAKAAPFWSLDEKVAFSLAVVQGGAEPNLGKSTEQIMDKDKQIADLIAEVAALKAKVTEQATAATTSAAELTAAKAKLALVEKRLDGVLRLDQVKDVTHVAWLKSDEDRDAFLGKGREARDELIKAATLHVGKDGTIYRPGQEQMVVLVKRLDAQDEALTKARSEADDATIAKAATDLLGKAPGGDTRVAVLKAIRAIADEPTRKKAEAWLGAVGKAYGGLLKPVGKSATSETGDDADAVLNSPDAAMAKLNGFAKGYRDADKDLDPDEAFARACDEHPDLYEAASGSGN